VYTTAYCKLLNAGKWERAALRPLVNSVYNRSRSSVARVAHFAPIYWALGESDRLVHRYSVFTHDEEAALYVIRFYFVTSR
jgi:hypothetical protein